MRLKSSKRRLLKILFLFSILLLTRSTVYSQNTLDNSQFANRDSIKCFTYSQARKILTDLRQLPIKDSIIIKQCSIIDKSEIIIGSQGKKVKAQRVEIYQNKERIYKLKKNRKLFIIFGTLLGLASQLIF